MIKTINNKKYHVFSNEFDLVPHKEYNNLKILKNLTLHERLIHFFSELKNINNKINNFICINTDHGGFIPIQCARTYDNVYLVDTSVEQETNIKSNIKLHNLQNIYLNTFKETIFKDNINIIFSENSNDIPNEYIENIFQNNIIITNLDLRIVNNQNYINYELTNSKYIIYVNRNIEKCFKTYFNCYINENYKLDYDNLINLCIMVKNAGPQFEEMLIHHLPIIDKWTILDTGSTDSTIDIIHKILVGKKSGMLYEEPFINFRDSRNRLLELAGTSCKFNVILDDTYIINGDLRGFLNEVRGDQYANSFTLIINSDDTQYGSNRVIKSDSGLQYIYKIHEVITDKNNINIIIPEKNASIIDRRFDYMEKRTMERKSLDLKLLYEELEDDPMNPRTYYYLGQTYNLLEDYENAYKYFLKRVEFMNSGFIQERIDAIFEAARIANFKLNKPWSECLELYEKCYKMDETRPESLYFIGIHYYLEDKYEIAYKYFKKGFQNGFPKHCQFSLKPTLSYHFLPKFLARVCYLMEDYILGEKCSEFFLVNNKPNAQDYQEILSWHSIYTKLNMYTGPKIATITEKPIVCFVADGGFEPWAGSNILTTGVGGSETYIIEMARWIQKIGKFNVIVFCNTPNEEDEVFEEVQYKHLKYYYQFINTHYVHTCIVSRFSEYLPVTFKGWTENVYLVVHDLSTSGNVIPLDKKLKNVFCLTEWHVGYFTSIFPQLKNITFPFYYGFNPNFKVDDKYDTNENIPYKFIYSSFPNRGLLPLLQMWPKIYKHQPLSSLHIYSDIDGKWVNEVAGDQMIEIKKLLNEYKNEYFNNMNIHYHGWVSKKELAESWKTANIWLYPCIFTETFCLTALEAAISKTFVVTNHLGALQNTAGDRGLIIEGNPMESSWQEKTLSQLFYYMDPKNIVKNDLIERNFLWASQLTWEKQANKLMNNYILNHVNIHLNNILDQITYINLYENDYHILKIGAYKGNVINDDVYHNIHSQMKVIFVEPVPSYFYQLKENYNMKYNGNKFIYINKAVSNCIGKMNIYYPSITNNFETLPWWIEQLASSNENHCKDHDYDIDMDNILVNTTTINELTNELSIRRLLLLIVDTEGHDFDILMDIDFSLIKPFFIKFENMHLSGYKNKGDKYNILLYHLQSKGYTLLDENESDTLVGL